MAKLLGTELSDKVMYQCLQFFGGYGYMEEYKMARMFRDSRIGTIGGGTSEIMREIIAKMVIDDKSYAKTSSNDGTDSKPKKTEILKEEKTKHNNQNTKIMSYENTLNAMKNKAASADALGSILKLNFGENQIVIDGTNGENIVSGDDIEANCTVNVSLEDFTAMVNGELNPMGAFMSGKMKVKGDTGVALKLQTLMG